MFRRARSGVVVGCRVVVRERGSRVNVRVARVEWVERVVER